MKTFTSLSAAALLSLGLAGGAFAQSEEPDCPEDFDTEPGCDMSQMDSGSSDVEDSEASPIEGAATAPVQGEGGDAGNTLADPDAEAPEPSEEDSSEPTDGSDDAMSEDASDDDTSGDDASGDDASDDSASDDSASDGDAMSNDGGDTETASAGSGGADHEVMARGVKFAPAILMIAPGDTVNWTNMASHNVETIDSMMPEGAASLNSEIGAPVSQTFETEGIIVYKCTPHWGNRMGGIIVVGDPENAMETIDAYMQAAEENTENLPALGLLKDLRAEMEGS